MFAPDVLVLDDAFQHRAIARDLNVLVVDGSRTSHGADAAGRKKKGAADGVAAGIRGGVHPPDPATGRVTGEATVRRWFSGPVLTCTRTIGSFVDAAGQTVDVAAGEDRERCVCWSAASDTRSGSNGISADWGSMVAGICDYRDHHRFTQDDVRAIAAAATAADVAADRDNGKGYGAADVTCGCDGCSDRWRR